MNEYLQAYFIGSKEGLSGQVHSWCAFEVLTRSFGIKNFVQARVAVLCP